jgi:hypothetical protein
MQPRELLGVIESKVVLEGKHIEGENLMGSGLVLLSPADVGCYSLVALREILWCCDHL